MTTLEEFVRDGVVIQLNDGNGDVVGYGIDQRKRDGSSTDFEISVWTDGGVEQWTAIGNVSASKLTHTQLRALSAMALWAAESMERKNNA